jgi:carboxyl-terminal processing protease
MNWRAIRNIFILITVAVVAGMVGYKVGTNEVKVKWASYKPSFNVTNKFPPTSKDADFSQFWTVWNEVTEKYVDKSKIDTQKMVHGAIAGMVSAVDDPYTMFLPPRANQESKEDLNGTFEGIGAQLDVDKDKRIVIVSPLPDSPAIKAGLLAGDYIIKVNGEDITKLTLPEVVTKIRGPKNTQVTITIYRNGEQDTRDFTITRDAIVLKSVEWRVAESTSSASLKPVAYIHLARFGDKTDSQWMKVVDDINSYLATSSANNAGVVLDLRNNPGGYLTGAVDIASEFLKSGVVVKQKNYLGMEESYSVTRVGKLLNVPLVVLINKGSASASEILAGSLQAAKRAKLVGVQSFGKGSVQEVKDFGNGSGLHVTIAKWLLSNDVWVQKVGLKPDVSVEMDPNKPGSDVQLERAIEVLNGR